MVFIDCLDDVTSALSWFVVQCDCATGYTGEFCNEDVDGCAESPCFGACTDVVAADVRIGNFGSNILAES